MMATTCSQSVIGTPAPEIKQNLGPQSPNAIKGNPVSKKVTGNSAVRFYTMIRIEYLWLLIELEYSKSKWV